MIWELSFHGCWDHSSRWILILGTYYILGTERLCDRSEIRAPVVGRIGMARFEPVTSYSESLLDGDGRVAAANGAVKRWKVVSLVTGIGVAFLGSAVGSLLMERSTLLEQRSQFEAMAMIKTQALSRSNGLLYQQIGNGGASRPSAVNEAAHMNPDSPVVVAARTDAAAAARPSVEAIRKADPVVVATATTSCTPGGTDIHDNSVGVALACCDGLVQINTPCRGNDICQYCVAAADAPAAGACTVAGNDIHDNAAHTALACCPGTVETDVTCRGTDTCRFCVPPEQVPKGCTPVGHDLYELTGSRTQCCPGLSPQMAPCRGTDMCAPPRSRRARSSSRFCYARQGPIASAPHSHLLLWGSGVALIARFSVPLAGASTASRRRTLSASAPNTRQQRSRSTL